MSARQKLSAAKRALSEELAITVEDAAVLLGMSRNGTYAAVKENKLPSIRIGRTIRIPSAALRSLLKVEASA